MKCRASAVKPFAVLILLLWLTACDGQPAATGRSAGGQSQNAPQNAYEVDAIRLAGGDWGCPTPFAHYPRGPGGFKMGLIFDSLLERDEKGLIPWLAQSYAVEDNGLTYRFTIRSGVQWQDGRPLTAGDVAFSIAYANRHAATWSYIFDAVATVQTASDHTVCVRLKQPHAAMLDRIGRTRIIPRHIWEEVDRPKEFTTDEAVIGCGPYRLTHYSKEHGTYRFEAFENFWGPPQRVKTIAFVPVSEPILAYENRQIDLAEVPPDVLPRFKRDPAHRIVRSPAFWGLRLLMNTGAVPCLRHVSIRQALAHAIDRDELVDKIERGAAVAGSAGILPPDHVMAVGDIRSYRFDPQQAGRLLEQAGCRRMDPDGTRSLPDGGPLSLELLCSSGQVRLAELIRQRLEDVGIGLSIRSVDRKTLDTRVHSLNYQLAIIGHGGWGGDPDYLAARFGGRGRAPGAAPSQTGLPGLDDPVLMDLLKRQKITFDPHRRRRVVADIQRKLAELVPEIPLYYKTGYSVYRPADYDGWMNMYDHHNLTHSKLSYLQRSGPALLREDNGDD